MSYLTSETTEPMSITPRKLETRRQKLQDIVQGVLAGKFIPKAEARACPRCPSFFVCGDLPSGAINIKKTDAPFRS